MIEHCIAAFRADQRKKSYRAYIANALKAIADNTTHHIVPNYGLLDYGTMMKMEWTEDEIPKEEEVEDTRSCSEIATSMWDRIRGE